MLLGGRARTLKHAWLKYMPRGARLALELCTSLTQTTAPANLVWEKKIHEGHEGPRSLTFVFLRVLRGFIAVGVALLRRRTKLQDPGFTENDLWIAAIGVRNGLRVVSQDSDFPRMAEAYPGLEWENWLRG